jgi:hypothetical protein
MHDMHKAKEHEHHKYVQDEQKCRSTTATTAVGGAGKGDESGGLVGRSIV